MRSTLTNLPALLALLVCATFIRAEDKFEFDRTPGKLPKEVVPRHYRLELKPVLDALKVSGHEVIELDVRRPIRQIVLNASELEILSVRLIAGPSVTTTLDPTNQLLKIDLADELSPGSHELELSFTGKITESTSGMFVMQYAAPSGPKKMIATQFEATDARRTFPCFDEPAFRARFTLTAEVPNEFQVVSNMPIEKSDQADSAGLKRVHFAPTPSMPTYLLVLVAGELQEIHDHVGQTETHIWFTEGKQEQARYALANSKRLLAFYNRYFGVRFPLPKLDHIALPGGFGGAMEHWGAITYNEGRLLYDPHKSSQDQKESSFDVMAHEMAHQWFGNLVTMAWWDNLWLNEGFASWMQSKATDFLNPEWKAWLRVDASKSGLMARDARKSTHPIQRPVASESQIGDAFDDITYGKGMLFIRMLEEYLGENTFRDGIRTYIKAHAYSNTTTADLWDALARASHKAVAEFATGWTEQPGLPVIIVGSHCENGAQQLDLRQERYSLLDPNSAPLRWKVPVTALVAGKKAFTQILVESAPVQLRLGNCDDPVKLNAGSRGYYRVLYDRPLFERLRATFLRLSEADRIDFLGDAWSMVESGRASADGYLDILPSLAAEQSVHLWEQTVGTLALINRLVEGQSFEPAFHQRVIALVHPVLDRLTYTAKTGEPADQSVLRARLFALLGTFDDKEVVAEAKRRFELFRSNKATLTGDLRAAVLAIVGQHATSAEHAELVRLAKAAPLEEDREILLAALAQTRDRDLARHALDLSLTKDFPPIESARLVSRVSAAGHHAQAAWDFMKQHHRELMSLMTGTFENMYASSTVSGFNDEAHASEYIEFIRANYPPDALAKAEEAADQIRFLAYLKAQILPSLQHWSQNAL